MNTDPNKNVVTHDLSDAFYKIVVRERDLERAVNARLKEERDKLRHACDRLRDELAAAKQDAASWERLSYNRVVDCNTFISERDDALEMVRLLREELAAAKQAAGSRMIVSRRLDWVRENLIDGLGWTDEAIDAAMDEQAEGEWHD